MKFNEMQRMSSFHKRSFVSVLRISSLVIVTHLYICFCAFAYTRLESNTYELNETVDQFLVQLKNGRFASDDVITVLEKYQKIEQKEKVWKEREWFKNFPKTFIYVLAAHTTLGNRHMNVKTTKGQVFYFFTVPLGVLLYYVMIHTVASKLVRMLKNASMLVWRKEDDEMSDRQRDMFVRLKLCAAAVSVTLVAMALLGTLSVAFNRPFITEIMYIMDVLYTISSSENFCFYEVHHDDINAILTTLVYLVLILLAYTTSSTIISLFWHHPCSDVMAFCAGDWVHRYFPANDKNDFEQEKGVWRDYRPIPKNEVPELAKLPDIMKDSSHWLHNDGEKESEGLKIPKSETTETIKSEELKFFERIDPK